MPRSDRLPKLGIGSVAIVWMLPLAAPAVDIDLLSLDLRGLQEIRVRDIGSLTTVSRFKTPAASTRITAEQIEDTGARSLQELIEIHVPGVQWVRHHFEFSHLGSRGIISDREDKVMIRVNGRVMNERTHVGAVTERNLPMLADIHYIDVVRGPGSSLAGLGAVSMVIDIHTHSAKTRQGTGVMLTAGAGHVYQSVEAWHTQKLDDDTGVYLYLAAANVEGANDSDAPWVVGVDACPKSRSAEVHLCDDGRSGINPATLVPAGSTFPIGLNDGLQYKDRAPLKFHLQVNNDNTDFWARYTRAGEVEVAEVFLATAPTPGFEGLPPTVKSDFFYEQFTVSLEHRHRFNDSIEITGAVSFDSTENARRRLPGSVLPDLNHREQEWFGKLHLDWAAGGRSDVVVGVELSYEEFGLKGGETDRPISFRLGEMEPWTTTTSSLVGEWQWRPTEQLTTFFGGRVDKNTYSEILFSPRGALIWTPDESTALKFIASRSQRMNFAEENRAEALSGQDRSRPETLDSLELRYEHAEDHHRWALGAFYLDLHAIGWDDVTRRSVLIAEQRQTGLELEWRHRFGDHSLIFSHAYTHLLDFEPIGGANPLIAAEPFDDLSNWSNHISKLHWSYQATERLKLHSSLRFYWGFPGLQDKFEQNKKTAFLENFIDADWEKGSKEQVFLNAGMSWELGQSTRLGLNLYNLMGLLDKDYNKRIYFNSLSDYRAEAPAAALSFSSEFH